MRKFRIKSKSDPNKSYIMIDDGIYIDHEGDPCDARLYHPNKDCSHIKKVKEYLGITNKQKPLF